MLDRQRLATFGIATSAAATIALAVWLKPWASGALTPTPRPGPVAAHRIDVVFAIDTTASMGGLIEGAKRTVWSIATHIHEIDKQADLHVGLVQYRDVDQDSGFVTRDFALNGDLDAVFAELSSYRADGGGDAPEDVAAGLYDAVHKMQWRDDANKMIFLVGDAPPIDRGDVPAFEVTARDAAAMQIKLNTIRCGTDPSTAEAWQQIAMLGHGEFSSIAENGGVHQIATPYDDQLAKLSQTIDSTAVIYGDPTVHARYEGKMAAAAAAPAPAKADRAYYYAKKPMAKGESRAADDIVGGVESGTVDIAKLSDDKLPAELRGKSKDELKAALDQRARQRADAQKELGELAAKRASYLRDHAGEGGGFDSKVKATVDHELSK